MAEDEGRQPALVLCGVDRKYVRHLAAAQRLTIVVQSRPSAHPKRVRPCSSCSQLRPSWVAQGMREGVGEAGELTSRQLGSPPRLLGCSSTPAAAGLACCTADGPEGKRIQELLCESKRSGRGRRRPSRQYLGAAFTLGLDRSCRLAPRPVAAAAAVAAAACLNRNRTRTPFRGVICGKSTVYCPRPSDARRCMRRTGGMYWGPLGRNQTGP